MTCKIKYITIFFLLLLVSCTNHGIVRKQEKKIIQVVAHRGDWRNYADNALEGIESCIRMGVDIVEIDIARTKDGHLILMHDRTIDRTTSGKGRVDSLTLDEIKGLYLRNGLGRVSEFKISTLEEAMLVTKGKIIVNLDKADKYFNDVFPILEKSGTTSQVIIKSDKPYEVLRELHGPLLDKMIFMPVMNLNDTYSISRLDSLLDKKYPYYEIVFDKEYRELLLHIKEKLSGTGSVIWINSLWSSLCAGYNDDKALEDPDGTWGYLIDSLGAGILQTDRPQMMLDYLKKRGLHE